MKFNKYHLTIIKSLTREESGAFIKFLESEIIRHLEDISETMDKIKKVKKRFNL